MSDYTITGAVASNNITAPLTLFPGSSLDIIIAADITVTLTIADTIAFPITITAEALGISSDVVTWDSVVTDTLTMPPVEFTVTATSTPVIQPKRIVSQNYLVTVTDSDARTQTFNVAVDNEDGYPTVIAGISTTSVPGAPVLDIVVPTTGSESSSLTLTWTAPTESGSSAITGYKIESGSPFTTLVADTGTTAVTYDDGGLSAATEVQYRISAINSVGTGPVSNVLSGTTTI